MRDRSDVVVVGTGIAGLSLAFELVRRGVTTVVVGGARRAARNALGLVNAQSRGQAGPEPFQDLSLLSRQLFADWVESIEAESGLAIEYDVRGGIAVSLTDAEDVLLDRALDWQRSRALPFTVLSAEEANVREPSLSEEIRTGFLFPLDGTVAPVKLHRSLVLAGRSVGVRFHESRHPFRLVVEGGRASGVETAEGRLLADAVVETGDESGLAAPVLAPPGVERCCPSVEVDCSSDPDRLTRFAFTGGGWIVPRRDATATIAGEPDPGTADGRPRAGALSALIEAAARAVPALRDYRVISAAETFCRVSPDGCPSLGAAETPGHYLLTGLGPDEILLAPAAALFLAEMLTGRTPPLPPGPYLPHRFRA
jgi:glycine oxidase